MVVVEVEVTVEAVGWLLRPGVGSRAVVVVAVLSEGGGALFGEGTVSSAAFCASISSGSSVSAGGVK